MQPTGDCAINMTNSNVVRPTLGGDIYTLLENCDCTRGIRELSILLLVRLSYSYILDPAVMATGAEAQSFLNPAPHIPRKP